MLLLLEAPIGYAIILAVVTAMVLATGGLPLEALPQQLVSGVDSFPLLAIPLFILAGEIMNHAGITRRLVNLAAALVGNLRGGLAQIGILSNLFMSGISGSGLADATATGAVLIPAMRSAGYHPAFSAAVLGSAAMLGPIVPPSLLLVVYGSIAGVSIGQLFLGGVIPGLVTTVILMLATAWLAWRYSLPATNRFDIQAVWRALLDAVPALLMPLLIIGGILSGVFTATEAASVAVVYALVVGLVARELDWRQLPGIFIRAAITSAAVCFIVAASNPLNWVLAWEQVPEKLFRALGALAKSPWLLLLVVNVAIFILGLPLDGAPLIIITAPVLLPLVREAGIDLVHFGVILAFNVMMGSLTPPVGPTMFALCRLADVTVGEFVRAWWPYCVILVFTLLLITYIPQIVVWLPYLLLPNG